MKVSNAQFSISKFALPWMLQNTPASLTLADIALVHVSMAIKHIGVV